MDKSLTQKIPHEIYTFRKITGDASGLGLNKCHIILRVSSGVILTLSVMRNLQEKRQILITQFIKRWKHRRSDWKMVTAQHFMNHFERTD